MKLLTAFLVAISAFGAQTVTTVCASGCDETDLQDAIDAAAAANPTPGNEQRIVLTAGETFDGFCGFLLPARTGTGFIIIESSGIGSIGERNQGSADAAYMATVRANGDNCGAFNTSAGSHHWMFRGLDMAIPSGTLGRLDILRIGRTDCGGAIGCDDDFDELPHHIIVERNWIHGNTMETGPRRCISLNGDHVIVRGNYIDECKDNSTDSQAIAILNARGPTTIINNFMRGAGENIIYGGSNPYIDGMVARNNLFRGNYLAKKWQWFNSMGSYVPTSACFEDAEGAQRHWNPTSGTGYECQAGGATWASIGTFDFNSWTANRFIVKNIFEIKSAADIVIDGNVFERNFAQSQLGQPILFNQVDNDFFSHATNPDSLIYNTRFRLNKIRGSYKVLAMGSLPSPGKAEVRGVPPFVIDASNNKLLLSNTLNTCTITLDSGTYNTYFDFATNFNGKVSGTACNQNMEMLIDRFEVWWIGGFSDLTIDAIANSAYATIGLVPSSGVIPGTPAARAYTHPTTNNIFENNLWYDIGSMKYNIPNSAESVNLAGPFGLEGGSFIHNTVISPLSHHDNKFALFGAGEAAAPSYRGVNFSGNLVPHGAGGLWRDCTNCTVGPGSATIAIDMVGPNIYNNVFVNTGNWPAVSWWQFYYNADFRTTNQLTPVQGGISEPAGAGEFGYSYETAVNFAAGTDNYRLDAASDYKGAGLDGRDPGADIDRVDWMTACAVTGCVNPYWLMQIKGISPTSSGGTIRYVCPDAAVCTVSVDTEATYTSPIFSTADSGGAQYRTMAITGLSAGTRYLARVVSATAGYRVESEFVTTP